MNADAAWDALNKALDDYRPGCAGHAAFIADSRTDDQLAECESICWRCPVRDLCGAYATAARVPVGVWAGQSYPPKKNTDRAAPRKQKKGTP